MDTSRASGLKAWFASASAAQRWLALNLFIAVIWPCLLIWARSFGWVIRPSPATTALGLFTLVLGLLWVLPWAKPAWTPQRVVAAAGYATAVLLLYFAAASFQFDTLGEGIYDLHYLASELRATRYPAVDLWQPASQVNRYYSFGYAAVTAAALPFSDVPAQVYLAALFIIPALMMVSFALIIQGGAVYRFSGAIIAVFPASFISVIVALQKDQIPAHLINYAHVRLLEFQDFFRDSALLAPLVDGVAYPLESVAHLVLVLGDLHPPLFSFYLLSLLLLWRYSPQLEAPGWRLIPGLLIPVSYFSNAWIAPVFALAALICAGQRDGWLRGLDAIVRGSILGIALLLPVLWGSVLGADAVALRWFAPDAAFHPLKILLVWLPQLLAFAILLFNRAQPSMLTVFFLGMIALMEIIHLDDSYSGALERFNHVLKWGSFILAGISATLIIEASRQPRWRYGVLAVLAIPCALQLHDNLAAVNASLKQRPNWQLDASAVFPREDQAALYDCLRREPAGMTLEFAATRNYGATPLIATALGFPTQSPWPDHLRQIGAWSQSDEQRYQHLQSWFNPSAPGAVILKEIDYVIIDAGLAWDAARLQLRRAELHGSFEFVNCQRGALPFALGYFKRIKHT